MMILMSAILDIVDYKITIKEVQDYAEYYFSVRTILHLKPMSLKRKPIPIGIKRIPIELKN